MILILDDHPIARQGLEAIIRIHKKNEVVLQAGNITEAKALVKDNDITIAFIDIHLGKESGLNFLEWIVKESPMTKTFMITSSSKKSDFFAAKTLGVDSYLLKDAFIDDIVYGLKVVEQGRKFYSADLIENLEEQPSDELLLQLTKREIEILFLLKQGYSNAKIGENLHIAEGTVKKHVSNILGKLNLANRVEIMLFADEHELALQQMIAQNE